MRMVLIGFGAAAALLTASQAAAQTAPKDNVVVTGRRPLKACSERDVNCIKAVAEQVWQDFPRQIELFCDRTVMEKQREVMDYEDFLGNSLDLPISEDLSPQMQILCQAKPKGAGVNLGVAAAWLPWAKAPSAADVAAAYPKAGGAAGGDGQINCALTVEGHLRDCVLVSETPDKQGFGVAALRLSNRFGARIEKSGDHYWLRDVRVNLSVHFPAPTAAVAKRDVVPDWTKTPDPAQTASLYPDAAAKAGVATGVGRVACRVNDAGALGDCNVLDEQPAGLGFGAAALAAAPSLKANLWTRAGEPASGGYVTVPLRFNAPTTATANAPPKAPSGS